MRPKNHLVRLVLAGVFGHLALVFCSPAWSQNYPTKAVRIVVPYAAGGPTDVMSRLVGQKLSEIFSQPVVIENRGGAGGGVGTELVARAAPDGYTLLWGTGGTHGINPSIYPKLPYDPVKDFAPITLVATGTIVLAAHPAVRATSVKELIALAKASPGKLNFASAGNGATSHLGMELFKTQAGVQLVHVPFKGAGPATVALLGGEVNLAMVEMTAVLPHIRSGKLKGFAVGGIKRSAILPDLPTLIESGLPGMEVISWHGLFAPAGTSGEIVARLNAEVARILRLGDVNARLLSLGSESVGGSPDQLATLVRNEVARWAKVVKESGAKID